LLQIGFLSLPAVFAHIFPVLGGLFAAFSRAGTESGRGNEPTPADESGTDTPGSVS